MKTRIITAAVGIALLAAVVLCPWPAVLAVLLAALAALAVWELLHNTGRVKIPVLVGGSMVFAALEVLLCYGVQCARLTETAAEPIWWRPLFVALRTGHVIEIMALVYLALLVLVLLRYHETADVQVIGYAAFATVYAATGFAALGMLWAIAGLAGFLLALVIPWMSDTGAYFVGVFFGKHKMTPVISPKKTWEGFVGGIVVSALSAWGYVAICRALQVTLPFSEIRLILATLVLAPLSVCGDLFASVIKRQSGIKDYGKIMPGHGGVMDRFDSVLVIAPLLCSFWILHG